MAVIYSSNSSIGFNMLDRSMGWDLISWSVDPDLNATIEAHSHPSIDRATIESADGLILNINGSIAPPPDTQYGSINPLDSFSYHQNGEQTVRVSSVYHFRVYEEIFDYNNGARIDLDEYLFSKQDNFFGSQGDDVYLGYGGNDSIHGDGGRDKLYGGEGDDYITGGKGKDWLYGGDGSDTANYSTAQAGVIVDLNISTFQRTQSAGKDLLVNIENLAGSEYDDVLKGDNGNNILTGRGGNDTLIGGRGRDTLLGGEGSNELMGGSGIDTADYSDASSGVKVNLARIKPQNTLSSGKDRLESIENLVGSDYNDKLFGNEGKNRLAGGKGDDTLFGLEGNDKLLGGSGSDTASYFGANSGVSVNLSLTNSQDTISAGKDKLSSIENLTGSAFDDILTGNSADNILSGGDGNDQLYGQYGNDLLHGGSGNDWLNGGHDIDTATYFDASNGVTLDLNIFSKQDTGSSGIDILLNVENLTGSSYADSLTGNSSDNYLIGNAGNDFIKGADGNDILEGGVGNDIFILSSLVGVDSILDFSISEDTIQLDQSVFTGLTETNNELDLGSFHSDNILDFNDVIASSSILFESSTGDIYYDADGGTGFNATLIASVTDGLLLSNTDFDLS